jgi:hypothetical protein
MVFNKNSNIETELEVFLFEEDGIWVSYCPALEVSSYGDNMDDAKDAFEDAVKIFFEETTKKGTLGQCLKQLGWEVKESPSLICNKPKLSISSLIENIGKKYQQYNEKVEIPAFC